MEKVAMLFIGGICFLMESFQVITINL